MGEHGHPVQIWGVKEQGWIGWLGTNTSFLNISRWITIPPNGMVMDVVWCLYCRMWRLGSCLFPPEPFIPILFKSFLSSSYVAQMMVTAPAGDSKWGPHSFSWAPQTAQWYRIRLPRQEPQEMQVWSLVWEDPLEMEMATHSSIPAGKIQSTEEPGGLQAMGFQKSLTRLRD